jgi:ATP-dependent helicase/nuclease subunit A
MSEARLVDQREREQIRRDLDVTLVVEAAAGTGKTSELVQRIVHVVESGAGKLSTVVAVTFTEKAAGEMKLRIRTELDRALSGAGAGLARERLTAALSELEAAKIGTIHALSADLLRAHPVEADVDPAFEVADTERARLFLRRAFDRFFLECVHAPPEGIRRVLARAALDDNTEDPRAALFSAASKLVETRDFDTPYRRDPLERTALIADLMRKLESFAELGRHGGDKRDPLTRAFLLLARRLRSVRGVSDDVREAFLRSLRRERDIWERHGRGKMYAQKLIRAEVVAQLAAMRAELDVAVTALNADLAACLSRELAPVIAAFEQQKVEHGALDFFDLLLRTRNLLRDDARVRAALQARFTHLFVDEFQDTDPVQAEILLLLAADRADVSDAFLACPVRGKLFVVGDPKQSIYRFRRADVLLYERVKRHLLAHGAQLITLSTSFRSLPAIQSVVNASFAPLMSGDPGRGQASYVPLSPFRAARPEQPAVVALPVPEPYGFLGKVTKKAINGSLPDAVAAFLDWLLTRSGYRVPEHGRDVQLAARHVCLLFKRFRSYDGDVTRDYVRALEARRIPHVLAGGRAFYAREEVIALCAVLRAIEWPDDALSVYATLRGPFVAFNDDALLHFRSSVGSLSPFAAMRLAAAPEGEVQAQIAEVLKLLVSLHRARNRQPIATTIGKFLSELRVHAGVAMWPTGEQSLGNLYKLTSLARSYESKRAATSFRGFIAWLEQNAEEAGAADATVVEESSDGVRIMTVHAAKGLEFPVVVLCDPTAPKRVEYASRYVDPETKLWAQSLCDVEPIELVEQRDAVREQDEAEVVRLLYVATTRARELLVVPVTGEGPIEGWVDVLGPALFPEGEARQTPLPNSAFASFGQSSVVKLPFGHEQIADNLVRPGEHAPAQGTHRVVFWDPNLLDLSRSTQGGLLQEELLRVDNEGLNDARGIERYAAFQKTREQATLFGSAASVRMRVVTDHAPSEDDELPMLAFYDTEVDRTTRPRGTRFGSLVHGLLQHASLRADEAELLALARYLARGLLATEAEVEQAVHSVRVALAHPLIERARQAESRAELFRETPITTRDQDGALLDGVVDLAFREHTSEGPRMILVDYKTDVEIADPTHYQRQLAGYAAAITRALGEPVECVLFRV